MARRGEHRLDGADLDDAAGIHHDDLVGDLGDDAEVVGDQHDRSADARRWSFLMSCRICAWMVTSSAVVGSSAISTLGRQERAMAIMARCSMPPES